MTTPGVPVLGAQAGRHIAQEMHPARLARDLRIDQIEGGMEAAVAVRGNQLQGLAGQSPAGERRQKGLPGRLRLVADQPEIDQFPLSGGSKAVGHKNQAALAAFDAFHPEADSVQEEVAVIIAQAAVVEDRHGLIQRLGDGRHGGRTDHVVQELRQDGPDLAGRDAAEEDGADQRVDVAGAPLIPGEHGGLEAAAPGAGDVEVGDRPPGGHQAPAIDAIPIPLAMPGSHVAAGIQMIDQLVMHPILEQELHRSQGFAGDIAPQGRLVLDLLPQIG